MRIIHMLDEDDIIHPDDWCRPLIRSADHSSYCDAWMEVNSYGGAPLDHLKWCPVWLCLGEIWWGDSYREIMDQTGKQYPNPMEYIRGDIPNSNKQSLRWNEWHMRHPLWWEVYNIHKEETLNKIFTFGKRYNGCSVGQVMRMDRQYIDWCVSNVHNELSEDIKLMIEGEIKEIWYRPEYRSKFNGVTQPVLRYN